jgi:hypothetical protein
MGPLPYTGWGVRLIDQSMRVRSGDVDILQVRCVWYIKRNHDDHGHKHECFFCSIMHAHNAAAFANTRADSRKTIHVFNTINIYLLDDGVYQLPHGHWRNVDLMKGEAAEFHVRRVRLLDHPSRSLPRSLTNKKTQERA